MSLFWTTLLGLVKQIPPVFWGTVVGSFFTVLGVILTNIANGKRLKKQFDHEIKLKAQERELQTKKDIYLSVAESISEGVTAIHKFSDLEITNKEVTQSYIEKSSTIAKVHIIGTESTVKAIAKYGTKIGSIFLELFAKRNMLQVEKSQIDELKNTARLFAKERDEIIEQMKKYNIDGVHNNQKWEFLERSYKFASEKASSLSNQAYELEKELYIKELEFKKVCIDYETEILLLSVPIVLAIRKELEIKTETNIYNELINDAHNKEIESINQFIKSSEDLFNRGGIDNRIEKIN